MTDGVIKFDTGGADDTLEVTKRKGRVWIEIDQPWWGDSETGFGLRAETTLDPEQVKQLIDFLTAEDDA
jgi:hypothetical protein